MGYVGLAATNTATNNMLLLMRGPDDGVLRVRLAEDSGVALRELRERLRKALPEQLIPWLQKSLEEYGLNAAEAAAEAKQFVVGFEPGDIVSEVMSLRFADADRGGDGGPEPRRRSAPMRKKSSMK